jgi:hypothetical protein
MTLLPAGGNRAVKVGLDCALNPILQDKIPIRQDFFSFFYCRKDAENKQSFGRFHFLPLLLPIRPELHAQQPICGTQIVSHCSTG